MPERFETYLAAVAGSIRWRRARPFALKELRTHLLEQKEDFLASGMTETEAEETAIREMGDAAVVGETLDGVHQPKEQRGLLCSVLALAVLGMVLRFALTWGWEFEAPHPLKTPLALLMGIGVLLGGYFLDYRTLFRHAGTVYMAALMAGIAALQFSPRVNHASWWIRSLGLLYPLIYALWVARWRSRKWLGFGAAILGGIPLCMVIYAAPAAAALIVLLLAGFAVMLSAAGRDWFGVGRNKGLAAAFGAAVVTAAPAVELMCRSASFQRRLTMFLSPEQEPLGLGYQGTAVRNMLLGAKWLGQGSTGAVYGELPYERIVPEWEADFLLTTVVHKLGWLPFLLFAGTVLALAAALLVKALRLRNGCGSFLALSAALTLGLQALAATVQNLGFVMVSVSMPLLSGNLHTVVTLALLGMVLSALRQAALPEEDPRAAESPIPAPQTV